MCLDFDPDLIEIQRWSLLDSIQASISYNLISGPQMHLLPYLIGLWELQMFLIYLLLVYLSSIGQSIILSLTEVS
jgi:hypothetical protein